MCWFECSAVLNDVWRSLSLPLRLMCLRVFCRSHRVCRNPILPWHKLSPEKLAKARLEKELESKRSVAGCVPRKMAASRLQAASTFNRSQGRPRLPLIGGKKFQSKLGSSAGSGLGLSKVRHLRMPRTGGDDKVCRSV